MFDKKLASGEHGGIAAVCGKAKLAAKLASHSVRDSHTLTPTFVKCSNRCSFILLDLILRLSARTSADASVPRLAGFSMIT